MDEVKPLIYEIDWQSVIYSIIIIVIGFVSIRKIVLEFCQAIGYVPPWRQEREEMKKAIASLQAEVTQIKEDQDNVIKKITDDQAAVIESLEHIKESVKDLKEHQNKSDRSRLKDRIAQLFRYYKEKGEWTLMEKETFDDLVESFRETGEHNTFVNEICSPQSQEFKIID